MTDADLSNGSILAFLGDSVMTLKVREYLVGLGITKADELTKRASEYVSAKAQALVVKQLLSEDFLSEKEKEIFRLGRNHKGHSKAKNADILTYRIASGYEALWGYWYLKSNPQRICELWDKARTILEHNAC